MDSSNKHIESSRNLQGSFCLGNHLSILSTVSIYNPYRISKTSFRFAALLLVVPPGLVLESQGLKSFYVKPTTCLVTRDGRTGALSNLTSTLSLSHSLTRSLDHSTPSVPNLFNSAQLNSIQLNALQPNPHHPIINCHPF